MGNSRWRLETALNYLGAEAAALGLGPADVEVLVADWGSAVPLADVVRLTPEAHRLARFLHIPPAEAARLQGDSPFPEVLALNAAARRATGDFIGRIDQDTLVGRRFLSWCCGAEPPSAQPLYFANRRDLPYRFSAPGPALPVVQRFVATRGDAMPVHRQNPFTGHVYWTSAVGIWLASREAWHEAGGYDERLIFYNWMETDMIHRLLVRRPIVDLGAITRWDFYHLEHYHPIRSWSGRPHAQKNAEVDLATPPAVACPSGPGWGLADLDLAATAATKTPVAAPQAAPLAWLRAVTVLAVRAGLDDLAIRGMAARHQLAARTRHATAALRGQPVTRWPGVVWALWSTRAAGRAARHAGWPWAPLRHAGARLLDTLGLLRAMRRTQLAWRLRRDSEIRARETAQAARASAFIASHGAVFAPAMPGSDAVPGSGAVSTGAVASAGRTRSAAARGVRRALMVSNRTPSIESELGIIAAVQDAGFAVTVLLEDEQAGLAPYYSLAGAQVSRWSAWLPGNDASRRARALLAPAISLEEAMQAEDQGVRVGRIAACTALRDLQLGELDLGRAANRAAVERRLAASLGAVTQARRILDALQPDLVVTDHEYTPKGELFECALGRGLDVVACDQAHRHDAVVFKRYHPGNRDRHLTTLAPSTWEAVQAMPWTPREAEAIAHEIRDCYARGDWYASGRRTGPSTPAAIRAALDLDPAKKTVVVFPHVLWDAPVLWGDPLFPSYQEWFLRTMRVAWESPQLNWVVKLHPSHVWRAGMNPDGRPEEVRVLEDQIGPRPAHVRLMPADTPIATDALLRVVDACVTVRGTVGVEAARLGVPVITAGQARYTHHGFTVDSASTGEYLDRLRHLADQPRLDDATRQLADRFAWAAFLLRPWRMTSVVTEGDHVDVRVDSRAALSAAPDIRALAAWFDSREEDFRAEAVR